MSLFSKVSKFARSPQGKKAMDKAKDLANNPETKQKIEQAREKLAGKDKGGNGVKHTDGNGVQTPTAEGNGVKREGNGVKAPTGEGNGVKHSDGNGVKSPAGASEPAASPVGEQPAQGNPPQTP